jgi:hypothetical protein
MISDVLLFDKDSIAFSISGKNSPDLKEPNTPSLLDPGVSSNWLASVSKDSPEVNLLYAA